MSSKSEKSKSVKKRVIIIITVVVACLIGVAAFILVKGVDFNKSHSEELVKEGFSDYFAVNAEIDKITAEFETDGGYIKPENKDDAIEAVGEYAKNKLESKEIKDYEITEGESVWIQFNSGVEYLYVPALKDCDSSAVSTYQPCLKMYDEDIQSLGVDCVDGSAEDIVSSVEDYSFDNNYDNEAITLDLIKEIGNSKIVIWHGHGGYSTKTHSCLLTSLPLDEEEFLFDPIYYVQNIGYTDDFLTGRIVCSNSGYIEVTYKFFEKYITDMDTDILYLGACSSGKDDVLANTFVEKGAKAVIANTDVICTVYNLNMINSVFDELRGFSEDDKLKDIKTALSDAKAKNGAKCVDSGYCTYSHNKTEVKIWGDDSVRLTEDAGKIKETKPIDYDAMLEKKKNELIDEYGVASTETYKKNLYSYNYAAENIGWTNREGILSAKLVDLDNDEINELLSVRLIRENGDKESSIEITAYKAGADGVQSAGTVSVPYGTEIESMEINIYTYNIGKTTYICYESYRYGILVDYQKPQYYVLEYSSGKLSKVMNIYNDYNGSDGIKFTMITEKDGKETSEDLCYSSSNHQPATGKYKDSDSPIGSAMEAFGFSASSKNLLDGGDHYPSYANQKNADLICTLKTQKTDQNDYKNYETQSSAKDYTGLDHSKSTTAPKKTVAWEEIYTDYFSKNNFDEFGSFNLVYVNDDDIPEIVLCGSFDMVASKLLWIDSSDTLHEEIIGGRTVQLTYMERQGKIMHSDFLLGEKNKNYSSVVVYSLNNDKFSTAFSGSIIGESNFVEISNSYKNNKNTYVSSYSVDNSEVSEKDFFKSLTGVYDIYSSDCKGVYNEDTSSTDKNDFIIQIEKY